MPQFKIVLNTPAQLCLGPRVDPVTEEKIIEADRCGVMFKDPGTVVLFYGDQNDPEVIAAFAPGTWRSVERMDNPR